MKKAFELSEKELAILNRVLEIIESDVVSTYEAFFMDYPKLDDAYKKLSKRIKKEAKPK